MSQIIKKIEKFEEFPDKNFAILNCIYKELKPRIQGKRGIMYSDIINLIIREGYKGDIYNQVIIWCNYNIRQGKFFVDP